MNYFNTGYRQVYRPPQTTCLRDSRWNFDRLHSVPVASGRLYTRTNIHARVRAPTATAAKRKRRKQACRFCGSARRPRGRTGNCRKYGCRTCVTKVIYRVIMDAVNSSLGGNFLLFVTTFHREYPVKCGTFYYRIIIYSYAQR